jgi:hypothetical protein
MGRLAPRESAPAGDPPRPAARRAAPATQVGIGLDRANSESEAAEAAIPTEVSGCPAGCIKRSTQGQDAKIG